MKTLIILLLLSACASPVTFKAPVYNQYNTGASSNLAIQYEWRYEMYKDGEWRKYSSVTICKDASATNPCSSFTPVYKSRKMTVDVYLINIISFNKHLELESIYFSDSGEPRIDIDAYPGMRKLIE